MKNVDKKNLTDVLLAFGDVFLGFCESVQRPVDPG